MAIHACGKEWSFISIFVWLVVGSALGLGLVSLFTKNLHISWSHSFSILLTSGHDGPRYRQPAFRSLHQVSSNTSYFPNSASPTTTSPSQTITADNNSSVLTIFTSFKNSRSRFDIHRNVLYNWAQFLPHIVPILFDSQTDPELISIAEKLGWIVLQVPKKNKQGTPYLKEMYKSAQQTSESTFYGYCNGDLLFDSGLETTLESIGVLLDQLHRTMIVGQRSNFYIRNRNLWKAQEVNKIAKKEGKLFRLDAEDYFFIAHNSFPWEKVPNVVIGRPAYDNFLVATAVKHGVSVIDATKTLLALHQTGVDGNFAGHRNKDAGHNPKVIGRFNYNKGLTSNAQYQTTFNKHHQVDVYRRGPKKTFIKMTPKPQPQTINSKHQVSTSSQNTEMLSKLKSIFTTVNHSLMINVDHTEAPPLTLNISSNSTAFNQSSLNHSDFRNEASPTFLVSSTALEQITKSTVSSLSLSLSTAKESALTKSLVVEDGIHNPVKMDDDPAIHLNEVLRAT